MFLAYWNGVYRCVPQSSRALLGDGLRASCSPLSEDESIVSAELSSDGEAVGDGDGDGGGVKAELSSEGVGALIVTANIRWSWPGIRSGLGERLGEWLEVGLGGSRYP